MSELRSTVDALRSEALADLPDARIEEDFAELHRAVERLEVERLRRLVRDRGCRFPGCDRPHTWCDAHHVVHWADGGSTAVANLTLLCRRHHRMIHRGRFRLERSDGRAVFRRPDGSILEEHRAPP